MTVPTKSARRIVVRPDQIFQNEPQRPIRRSFEGVVVRYILVSAAVVVALSTFAALATMFLGH